MNPILKSYIPTAEMISKTFGKSCEVVLHDLSQPKNSVIYVANGCVTGRKPGQSFKHLVNEVLLSKDFKSGYAANYTFLTEDQKLIKASSSLIRDENNDVIGMLCVNIDISAFQQARDTINDFLPNTPSSETSPFDLDPSLEILDIIDKLISDILRDVDVTKLKRKDKIELIDFMNKKGIFLVKGTIDKVAEQLGVSKITIYSYLDKIRLPQK